MAAFHLIYVATGKRAVMGVGPYGEVDVAIHHVGMLFIHQGLDQFDHGRDLFGGLGADGGISYTRSMHVGDERLGVLGGHFGGAASFLGSSIDDLVIHIGHVLHEGHLEAAPFQVAPDHVEGYEGARIADMDAIVYRWAAYIHAHFPLMQRDEVDLLVLFRIVQADHGCSSLLSSRHTA